MVLCCMSCQCRFKEFCIRTGRSSLVCEGTASAIASSPRGLLGRRVGTLCQSLAECPALASSCDNETHTPLDYCTTAGYQSSVPGSRPADLPEIAMRETCSEDAPCGTNDTVCGAMKRVCSCNKDTGAVVCEMLGTCKPSPCKVCRDCINSWQGHVSSVAELDSSAVATAFQDKCDSMADSVVAKCSAARSLIIQSQASNLGRRAGAICSILGACTLNEQSCTVAANNLTGPLDLCSKEGVAGGSMDLPDVYPGSTDGG